MPFRTLPRAGLPDAFVFLDGFHDLLLFSDGACQRFLAVNVLAVVRRLDRHERVPMVRQREHHGVNVLARAQLAVIRVSLAALVLIFLVYGVRRALQMVLVHVADRDNLAVVVAQETAEVATALPTHADAGDDEAFGWRNALVATQGAGGDDSRYSDRGPGNSDKPATADS